MMPHEADHHATALADALLNDGPVNPASMLGLLKYLCGVSIKARGLLDHVVREAMIKDDRPLLEALVDAGLLDVVDILGSM